MYWFDTKERVDSDALILEGLKAGIVRLEVKVNWVNGIVGCTGLMIGCDCLNVEIGCCHDRDSWGKRDLSVGIDSYWWN